MSQRFQPAIIPRHVRDARHSSSLSDGYWHAHGRPSSPIPGGHLLERAYSTSAVLTSDHRKKAATACRCYASEMLYPSHFLTPFKGRAARNPPPSQSPGWLLACLQAIHGAYLLPTPSGRPDATICLTAMLINPLIAGGRVRFRKVRLAWGGSIAVLSASILTVLAYNPASNSASKQTLPARRR